MHVVSDRTRDVAAARLRPRRLGFRALGCDCEVVLAEADPHVARQRAARVQAELLRIERKFTRAHADSLVARINAAAGHGDVLCDDETLGLLAEVDALHAASDGLFDPTVGVLARAWDFQVPDLPTRQEVDGLLPLIGWARVRRDGRRVGLPESGMAIDLDGLAKAHAADRAAALLREAGARHGYVKLGGDVHAIGPQPDHAPWRLGIPDPRAPWTVVATVPLAQGGLATTSDQTRSFEVGGRRYGHVLDPHTGWPVSNWRTVSVQAASTVHAAGSATVAMLKRGQALPWLEATGHPFVAIDHLGHMHLKGALPVDDTQAGPDLQPL